ncbi:MAG: fluoride efflux transporter CrcB [Oscillospiraceae bacterium]|nr:fluoride efflux transporter CrcB [Oscillospiraceae bacterium]
MFDCLAVGAGGFIGAVLRWLIGLIPVEMKSGFPIKTLAVNIVGCFAIGLITALVAKFFPDNTRLTLFLKTGICGGFTTFSTFALETEGLFEKGGKSAAIIYITASLVCGVFAVFLGQKVIK